MNPTTGESISEVTISVPPLNDGKRFRFLGLSLDSVLLQKFSETGQPQPIERGQFIGKVQGNNIRELLEGWRDTPKDSFNLVIDITKGNVEAYYKAMATGDLEVLIEALRPDTTTLGEFFPYYLE